MNLQHWADALNSHWGITADLRRLDGEYDLNFMATDADGTGYILKAMRPGCEAWLVEMQVQAFQTYRGTGPRAALPSGDP